MNIASLKQQDYTLMKIFDPNLKKRKQERKENMKKKFQKYRMKRKGQRSTT
ncbi:hypothetical protein GTO27_00520 [Candidatus Bathyarchaeota archaeon]|nr:hypothetical protein [Candidatus Bathyarchaeota archaeon]